MEETMATKLKPVDVVTIGVGWAGTILAKELAQAGLKVVGLERGGYRGQEMFQLPEAKYDQLKYDRHLELFEDLSRTTITFRNRTDEVARPMREHGPFPWGEGLGGAGFHWAGWTWRQTPWNFEIRSRTLARYGEKALPEHSTVQDWPVTYDELEPYYDKFEYTCGISGKAGNLRGIIQSGGNPFEGPRARGYPNPPLKRAYGETLFGEAAEKLGYHPFPMPAAQSSQAYTNPDGASLGECMFCGFCMNYGCEWSAKAVPQTTTIPPALATGNYEIRTHAAVTRINVSGNRATGVTYVDSRGHEIEQPADIVLLTAFTWSNTQLMLVSGIGTPYDPATGKGVVGKNYAWHGAAPYMQLLYDEGHIFNPFMGTGALGTAITDFEGDNFDHADLGFVGGSMMVATQMGQGPLTYQPVPPQTPLWGSAWKRSVAHYYNRSFWMIGLHDHLPYRGNYLDLDPNYRDVFGNPLLRVTYDIGPNEHRLSDYMVKVATKIGEVMQPSHLAVFGLPQTFDAGAGYGIVHQVGGAMMGTSPENSVVNKYLQSWDVPNLFVVGASAFPQLSSFNPTGTVGALAYQTADAIKNKYLRHPGLLI
jgi:gluconate 2-dehydrogenase alpha chain